MEKSFPDTATKEERASFNLKLGHIIDSDLNVEKSERVTNPNYDVRILLENGDGEICVVKSEKHGYIQLPGGGVEEGESIEEAVRRETREETGYKVEGPEPLGYFLDDRNRSQKTVFVYTAKAGENVGTNYMDDEVEEGFVPVWMSPEKIIEHLAKVDEELNRANTISKSYNGAFATRRDLMLMQYYAKTKK